MFVRRLSEPSAENASMMAQIINILVGYVFVPVGTFMAFLLLMLKRSRKFQEVFSACVFFPLVSPFFKSAFEGIRREVMRNLDDVVSCDPVLRESNAIRVLEVGVGTGRNFEYINRNVKFLAVDPNSAFKDRFLENQANYSHIELEEWVLTRGEDMKQLPDNFVDAVIITHVLCSVVDARKVLSECRRVLTPVSSTISFCFLDFLAKSSLLLDTFQKLHLGSIFGWGQATHALLLHICKSTTLQSAIVGSKKDENWKLVPCHDYGRV